MESLELQHIYTNHPGVIALEKLQKENNKKHVFIGGLTGSAAALVLSGLRKRAPRQTFLIVMNDAEEAGYMYHDMTQICGEENILFFPKTEKEEGEKSR